jgi:hypothetical protein
MRSSLASTGCIQGTAWSASTSMISSVNCGASVSLEIERLSPARMQLLGVTTAR